MHCAGARRRAPLTDAGRRASPATRRPGGRCVWDSDQGREAEGKQPGGPLNVRRALRTRHSHLGKAPAGGPPAGQESELLAPWGKGEPACGVWGGSRQQDTPWEEGPGCTPAGRVRGQLGWGHGHTELTSTATARSRSPGPQGAQSPETASPAGAPGTGAHTGAEGVGAGTPGQDRPRWEGATPSVRAFVGPGAPSQ